VARQAVLRLSVSLALFFGASLILWVGFPLAALWIASQVQGATQSPGLAIGAGMLGFLVAVIAYVPLLARLDALHRRLRALSGRPDLGTAVLETVMVTSAGSAVLLFGGWFLLFSGASPIPLGLTP
jgi:hypothetical protein